MYLDVLFGNEIFLFSIILMSWNALDLPVWALFPSFFFFSQWNSLLTDDRIHIYASPISGEAYRDRRLTTNFEL